MQTRSLLLALQFAAQAAQVALHGWGHEALSRRQTHCQTQSQTIEFLPSPDQIIGFYIHRITESQYHIQNFKTFTLKLPSQPPPLDAEREDSA